MEGGWSAGALDVVTNLSAIVDIRLLENEAQARPLKDGQAGRNPGHDRAAV